jgi:hypothetical protein
MLRANSRLRGLLGSDGVGFLIHIAGSIERILPHVELPSWEETDWHRSAAVWTTTARREIRLTVGILDPAGVNDRALTTLIRRRRLPVLDGSAAGTLDMREYDICRRIATRTSDAISQFLSYRDKANDLNPATINALRGSFDESVIAEHIESHHHLKTPVSSILSTLHTLSEQTYENKAMVFGCVIDPEAKTSQGGTRFPEPFLGAKKYKALSDGFRTAYYVSGDGHVTNFVDLERTPATDLTQKHYYPEWTRPLARASRAGKCGIALTRQGDILVFDEGALRLTYRYGGWRYWNHAHVVNLLRDRARTQRVPRQIVGSVVGSIYRAALDISFRRSGGLFVVLHNRRWIHEIVRLGDAVGDDERILPDSEFDLVVRRHKMQSLPRAVAVELASLDGAVVLANSGEILAYGAVLQPKRRGFIRGSEGSRTKAAIGASTYGLAIKISSDGDITTYFDGREFFRI